MTTADPPSSTESAERRIEHATDAIRSMSQDLADEVALRPTWIEQVPLATPEASRLLNQTGHYQKERAQYAEAGLLFQRALALIDSVAKSGTVFEPWSFGGGTVLMRKFRHRFSKDIDIFVPDPQYLGHVSPRLNDAAEVVEPHLLLPS